MERLCTAIVLASCLGCGGGSGSPSGDTPIVDGSYTLSGPVCDATGAKPEYPPPSETAPPAAALFRDFSDTTSRELTLQAGTITEVVQDADCKFEIVQKVSKNDGSEIHLTKEATYSWTPSGCSMQIAVGGQPVPIDANTGGGRIYANSTDTSTGAVLAVSRDGDTVQVATTPLAGLGCGDVGKFRFTWTPKSKS